MFKIEQLTVNVHIHLDGQAVVRDLIPGEPIKPPEPLEPMSKSMLKRMAVQTGVAPAPLEINKEAFMRPIEGVVPRSDKRLPGNMEGMLGATEPSDSRADIPKCCGYDFHKSHTTIGLGPDGLFHRKGCPVVEKQDEAAPTPAPEVFLKEVPPPSYYTEQQVQVVESTITQTGSMSCAADKPRHKQDPTKGWPVCPQCNVHKASHLFKDADGVKQPTCNRCRGTLKSQKTKPPSERKPSLGAPKETPKPSPFEGTDKVVLQDGAMLALARRDQICNDCKRNVDTHKEPYVGGICIECTAPGLTHAAAAHFRRLKAMLPQTNDVVSCKPGDDD